MRPTDLTSPPAANPARAHMLSSPALLAAGASASARAGGPPSAVDAVMQVTVGEAMSAAPAPVVSRASLAEAADRLDRAEGCAAHIIPVVAGPGGPPWPVGMFGRAELTAAWRRGLAPDTPVEALMTPFVLAVPVTAPLAQGIALMAFEGVHVLGVLGQDNRLVGMLGALDVLLWLTWAACDG